ALHAVVDHDLDWIALGSGQHYRASVIVDVVDTRLNLLHGHDHSTRSGALLGQLHGGGLVGGRFTAGWADIDRDRLQIANSELRSRVHLIEVLRFVGDLHRDNVAV